MVRVPRWVYWLLMRPRLIALLTVALALAAVALVAAHGGGTPWQVWVDIAVLAVAVPLIVVARRLMVRRQPPPPHSPQLPL